MTKKKVSSQLKKARALINKGWCKGALRVDNHKGSYNYCSIGALLEVTKIEGFHWGANTPRVEDIYWPAKQYLYTALELIQPSHFEGATLEGYNDHRKTTKRDILDLYDVAIKLAQKDEVK